MHAFARALLFGGLFITPLFAQAKIIGIFDKDGTINNDRGPEAAWITPWILKRVDSIYTVAQQAPNKRISLRLTDPEHIAYFRSHSGAGFYSEALDGTALDVRMNLPDQIQISYDEFTRIERWMPRGASASRGFLGEVKPFLLDFDPMFPQRERLIIPGYYRLFDNTFKYYRESTSQRRKNYLLIDYQNAKKRAELLGDGHTWKGPAFPLLRSLTSRADLVRNQHVFTSRGQPEIDFYEFFDELVRDGEIAYSRDPDGRRPIIHALNQPESRVYGTNLVEKKAAVVKMVLDAATLTGAGKHWEPTDAEGRLIPTRTHTLIVTEEEPSYVEAVAKYLYNASGGYMANQVKLVLLNAGKPEDIAQARFPYEWTVFYSPRRFRPATPEEIDFWLHQEREPLTCAGLLSTENKP